MESILTADICTTTSANTPAEIRGDGVMTGEDGVVSPFRRLLKTYGLIVVGCSSADARVLALSLIHI